MAFSNLLLLDVNVLLALAWPNHQFHSVASQRLELSQDSWATCALTQLGFVRLSSNPAVVRWAKTPSEAGALLAELTGDPMHTYLGELPAPSGEPFASQFAKLIGHQQVTDAYLLALAAHHEAKLLTFDGRLRRFATSSGGNVEVLPN